MPKEKRNIAVLGSTGSMGCQALEVVNENPDFFNISVLTANTNADQLIQQALAHKPNSVVICDEDQYQKVSEALQNEGIKVFAGQDSLEQIVTLDEIQIVLTAMVGFSGLRPTVKAIESGKHIALANKETLVVAGKMVTELAAKNQVSIIPVDSEHSAIFQCLTGEWHNPIEKIYLTASGGPFRGMQSQDLKTVTKDQALTHPTWDMGAKITIDSATMMNKGLEVIEAKWLFNLSNDQIDVIVHPQSVIHSLVQFEDGTMKAEMGPADMRRPIQYALAYPDRLPNRFPRFGFEDYQNLTFEKPDFNTFRNLALAFKALKKGGNMACILNAANEITVDAFLKDVIRFPEIAEINEACMEKVDFQEDPSLDDFLLTDENARASARAMLNQKS